MGPAAGAPRPLTPRRKRDDPAPGLPDHWLAAASRLRRRPYRARVRQLPEWRCPCGSARLGGPPRQPPLPLLLRPDGGPRPRRRPERLARSPVRSSIASSERRSASAVLPIIRCRVSFQRFFTAFSIARVALA